MFMLGSTVFLMFPFIFSLHISDFHTLIRFKIFQEDIVSYCLLLLFFYFCYFYLIPELLFKRKSGLFILIIVICFVITVFSPKYLVEVFGMFDAQSMWRPHSGPHRGGPMMKPGPNFFFMYGRFIIVFLVVFFFSYFLKINQRLKQTEQDKLKAELSFLKAQINPHFLFNTLNSIYALAIEKSDDTPDAVVKLSELLRYVITDTQQDYIPLSLEMNYIRDYLDLQKIRLGNTMDLQYHLNISDENFRIAPMLLLPFIENAFKYGVSTEKDSPVEISLTNEGNSLILTTKNNKNVTEQFQDNQNKIGHRNTLQRLEFMYPGRYEIDIDENEEHFYLKLKIQIES